MDELGLGGEDEEQGAAGGDEPQGLEGGVEHERSTRPLGAGSLANITDEATPTGEVRSGRLARQRRRQRPIVLHQPRNDTTSSDSGTASPEPP